MTPRLAALVVLAPLLVGEATPECAQSYDTTGAPEELPYRAGEQVPLGYHLERGPRGDTVAAGSVLFGLSYGVAVAVGASDGLQNKKGYLLLPVLPLLSLALEVLAADDVADDPRGERGQERHVTGHADLFFGDRPRSQARL